jgi:hypothetical protein
MGSLTVGPNLTFHERSGAERDVFDRGVELHSSVDDRSVEFGGPTIPIVVPKTRNVQK